VLRRDGAKAGSYEDPQGFYPLRRAIVADLARHGILAEADDIIITWGAQEGVSLIARMLAAPDDWALTETPAFFGTLFNLQHLGINLRGFELSPAGPNWHSLIQQMDSTPTRPRFVYVSPDHENPTGICWSMPERHRFLQFVSEHDFPVIEDATYTDLTYEGPPHLPLRALDPGVLYVSSFSKRLMPGLRIGFIVANGRMRGHIITLKTITSGSGESLSQRTLAEFLTSGDYAAHLERVIPIYRARRNAMLEALDKYFPPEARWTQPSGGFYIWVSLPDAVSMESLFRRALDRGVAIAPSMAFYPYRPFPNAFRLAFSRYSEDVLTHAVRILADAVKFELAHPN
jgi:GntR family transcriptional regulator/MocR family aminotransferase